jgi:hypothetical protein
MRKHDLEVNLNRLNTARRSLWKTQELLEKITTHISDSNLRTEANNERISVEGVRSILHDVETFLNGQNSN